MFRNSKLLKDFIRPIKGNFMYHTTWAQILMGMIDVSKVNKWVCVWSDLKMNVTHWSHRKCGFAWCVDPDGFFFINYWIYWWKFSTAIYLFVLINIVKFQILQFFSGHCLCQKVLPNWHRKLIFLKLSVMKRKILEIMLIKVMMKALLKIHLHSSLLCGHGIQFETNWGKL